MNEKLSGIPETMLIPLWARAIENGKSEPIIRDEKAMEMVNCIDYPFAKFEKSWMSQLGICIRTMLFDNAAADFIHRNPGAQIVNLGAGLDTRYHRLSENNRENIAHWYDLDIEEAITLRHRFMTEDSKCSFIAKSVFDYSWLKAIKKNDKPLLFIAEGLLMYFSKDQVVDLLGKLISRFPGSEMLIEILAPFLLGKSSRHDSLKQLDYQPEFKWTEIEASDITHYLPNLNFIEEWNYYDFYRSRWKWFGWLCKIPPIHKQMSSRIVHFNFGDPEG